MKKLTEEERNVDVVIKTSIVGACLVTAARRSAGSRVGELGVLLLIDKSSSVNKRILLRRVHKAGGEGPS
jgi:hypothetical protein